MLARVAVWLLDDSTEYPSSPLKKSCMNGLREPYSLRADYPKLVGTSTADESI